MAGPAEAAATGGGTVRPFEVTHRQVVAIALPTTLAFISTPLLGLVDTGVVGSLGDAALLGGLAVGAILFDIVFTSFNFLRASTTGLTAQAVGAQDEGSQRRVLARALLIAVASGLALALAGPLILAAGLLFMNVTPAVEEAVRAYFSVRILAAPLTLVNYVVLGWLLGRAQAGLGLLLQSVLNGANIALSVWFGLGLGFGLTGVAWATVAAEALTVLVGAGLVWRLARPFDGLSVGAVLDRTALWRLFAVNGDIMIRSFCLILAFALLTREGATFGETVLAANAVLMNFFLVAGYFLDGFATAAEQLAGKSVGARYRPAFERAVRLCLVWGAALALACTAFFLLAGPSVIDLLSANEAVRATAYAYLPWAAVTALAGVVAFQMDGTFIGATWTRDMRNQMLVSLAVYVAALYALKPLIGNHGLWLALNLFLAMRGVTLWLRVRPNLDAEFAAQPGRARPAQSA